MFKSGLNGEGELVVEVEGLGTMYILNWGESGGMSLPLESRPGHITVAQYDVGAYQLFDPNKPSHMTVLGFLGLGGTVFKAAFGVETWGNVDPLTLDLDGDGIELINASTVSPRFDLDGDGKVDALDDGLATSTATALSIRMIRSPPCRSGATSMRTRRRTRANCSRWKRSGLNRFPSARCGKTLHAPHLLDVEVAQVLCRYAAMGEIGEQRGAEALADLADFPIPRYPHDFLLARIWNLRSNFTACYAVYVALAEALGARLLTRDQRLATAVRRHVEIELA